MDKVCSNYILGTKEDVICINGIKKEDDIDLSENVYSEKKTSEIENDPTVYHCNLCEEMYPTEELLKHHIQGFHCFTSADKDNQDELLDSEKDEEDKHGTEMESVSVKLNKCKDEYCETEQIFQCGQCVQHFKSLFDLKHHSKTHTSGRSFKCDICSKEFKLKSDFDIHAQTHMDGELPPKYEICSKKFPRKEVLKMHTKMEDNKDLTFDLSSMVENSKQKKRQVKPKVCSNWSDEEIFKLIRSVECEPMLWDVKDGKYRNKIERQSAWKKISQDEFHQKFTDTELMAKWSNMRIQYRSYFAKTQKSKLGQGGNETVKWKFYEAMGFIGQTEEEQSGANVSNLVNTDKISVDGSICEIPKRSQKVTKCRRETQSSSISTTSSATCIVAEGVKHAVHELKEQRQKREREDEFDAFGKYVATEIRSLSDPSAAQRVRFKVARFLMDCIEGENQKSLCE